MKPYGYQKIVLKRLISRRENGFKTGLVVMATGLGKTVVAAEDLLTFIREKPGRVLFLCHDIGIMKRQLPTFQSILGWNRQAFGYLDGRHKDLHAEFLFSTFQTMKNYLGKYAPTYFTYIIVDESHHSMAETFEPVILHFKPEFLLALTATPDREDLRNIRRIYGKEVVNISLPVALARRYLCDVDYRLFSDTFDKKLAQMSDISFVRVGVKGLNKILFQPRRDDEIIQIILEKVGEVKNPKVGVFCNNIEEAERYAQLLPNAVAYHSGLTESQMDNAFKLFESGIYRYLITIDKLNEGIDIPDLNVLVFLRSTASRRIFFQQFGRGLRKAKGKKKVLVLDFAGNIKRIEMIEQLKQGIIVARTKIEEKKHSNASSVGNETDVDHLAGHKFEFEEEVINLLSIVARIRRTTKEELVTELKTLGRALGRTPTSKDIVALSVEGNTKSLGVYYKTFGSFNLALVEAGFNINRVLETSETKEQMILNLRQIAAKLGRTPKADEIQDLYKQNESAFSLSAYQTVFSSYTRALIAADIALNQEARIVRSDEELIAELRRVCDLLGYKPSREDIRAMHKRGETTVSVSTYSTRFGGLTAALQKVGYVPKKQAPIKWSKEDVISSLQERANQLGRTPTSGEMTDWDNSPRPSFSMIVKLFGSYNAALKAAGLPIVRNWHHHK